MAWGSRSGQENSGHGWKPGWGGRVPAAASQPPQHPGGGPALAASRRAELQLLCLLSAAGLSPTRFLDSSPRPQPVTARLSLWSPRESCHTAVRALSCPWLPRRPVTAPLQTAAAVPRVPTRPEHREGSARRLPSRLLCLAHSSLSPKNSALASSPQVPESAWGPQTPRSPCLCSLLPPANHTARRGFEPRQGARLLAGHAAHPVLSLRLLTPTSRGCCEDKQTESTWMGQTWQQQATKPQQLPVSSLARSAQPRAERRLSND